MRVTAAVLFAIAGSAYLLALLVIHLLVPRIEPVQLGDAGNTTT